jgi:hypothetical protein
VADYPGDSPGKKVIRANQWLGTRDWMRILGQPFKGALCLAGHGGDAITLAGMGIDTTKVFMADLLQKNLIASIDNCAARNIDLGDIYPGDVGEYALTSDPTYNVSHLDFQCGFTSDSVEAMFNTAIGADQNGPHLMNVTVLKGRDDKCERRVDFHCGQDERLEAGVRFDEAGWEIATKVLMDGWFNANECLDMGKNMVRSKRIRQIALGHLMGGQDKIQNAVNAGGRDISGLTQMNNLNGYGHSLARMHVAAQILSAMLVPYKLSVIPLDCYGYFSAKESGKKKKGGSGLASFSLLIYPTDNEDGGASIRNAVRRYLPYYKRDCILSNFSLPMRHGWVAAKHHAVQVSNLWGMEKASLLYNVTPGQIGAWKAHFSMGTYDKEMASLRRRGLTMDVPVCKKPKVAKCPNGWGDVYNDEMAGVHWKSAFKLPPPKMSVVFRGSPQVKSEVIKVIDGTIKQGDMRCGDSFAIVGLIIEYSCLIARGKTHEKAMGKIEDCLKRIENKTPGRDIYCKFVPSGVSWLDDACVVHTANALWKAQDQAEGTKTEPVVQLLLDGKGLAVIIEADLTIRSFINETRQRINSGDTLEEGIEAANGEWDIPESPYKDNWISPTFGMCLD